MGHKNKCVSGKMDRSKSILKFYKQYHARLNEIFVLEIATKLIISLFMLLCNLKDHGTYHVHL